MKLLNGLFWKDALERAIRSAANALLSLWIVGDVVFNLLEVDWGQAFGIAAGAAVASVLLSLGASQVNNTVGPASTVKVTSGEL
jgi:hypothetical protein